MLWRVLEALLLIMAANGAPILLVRLLPGIRLWPVDGGRCLRDGRRLFGHSKTWQGVWAAVGGTTVLAMLLGHAWFVGAAAGAAAMVGDLFSSFIKRRMGIPASGQALAVDQLPEALLPALVLTFWLPLTVLEVLVVVLLFFVLELPLSRVLFHLGVRKKPY